MLAGKFETGSQSLKGRQGTRGATATGQQTVALIQRGCIEDFKDQGYVRLE